MSVLFAFFRFALGVAFGSFLNVVAFRYDPARPLWSVRPLRGRSHCRSCGSTLRFYELIPLASFLVQKGRCRQCRTRLSLQYPLVELASGLAFAFIPGAVHGLVPQIIWLLAGLTLILIAAIDARLMIIPDEANIFLGILGIALAAGMGRTGNSFLGYYASMLNYESPLWLNRLIAVGSVVLIFGAAILLSRGRGMGLGDLKMASAIGLLMGWPDVLMATLAAFVIGAAASIAFLLRRRKTLKSSVPFGPFISLGVFVTVFFGFTIMKGYFAFFTWLYGI